MATYSLESDACILILGWVILKYFTLNVRFVKRRDLYIIA